ncbi:SNARE domain protein [Cooperia oncophora]
MERGREKETGSPEKAWAMISTQSSRMENNSERKLRENTVSALIFTLSQLTNEFRTRQSKYLKDIKNRTSNVDNFLVTTGQSDEMLPWVNLFWWLIHPFENLNTLFKDLSTMVVDQGTILDRIDYNVEQASIRVSRAVDSVKKAEKHQRNDKKMHCIFCQTVAIIVILLLIIFTKL